MDFPERMRELPRFGPSLDVFSMMASGARALFGSYRAGVTLAPHAHDTDNYGTILEGELVLTVDGAERTYRAGDWYHLPPNTSHASRFPKATRQIDFWFDPA
ncbi:MAG: cupin domain-containing protein [Alphaproteobacteria bacterium]|nr:cupin domain-containing protein [Alphaproteobacteria bacterium]